MEGNHPKNCRLLFFPSDGWLRKLSKIECEVELVVIDLDVEPTREDGISLLFISASIESYSYFLVGICVL